MNPLENTLLNFLSDKSLKVASLKGEWGIGKTYFWNSFFKSQKSHLKFKGYSYGSLFGITNITDLSKQIFSNFEILDKEGIRKHMEKLKPVANAIKSAKIPYLDSTSIISNWLEGKIIDDFLICIDDLERKEDSITASAILGFVSKLKEEKGCKIILIYNDQKLEADAKKEIEEYREKVIDIELTYKPSIDDNLQIIWPQGCPANTSSIFNSLKLNNIRIMQRVKWSQDYFMPHIITHYSYLKDFFEIATTALTIIHHAYTDKISLEEAQEPGYASLMSSKDGKHNDRFELFKRLNYWPDEKGAPVAIYLRDGHVDLDSYKDLLKKNDENSRVMGINEAHRTIWGKYYKNFSTNNEEFIAEQLDFLTKHADDLRLLDVCATVDFVLELDESCGVGHFKEEAIKKFAAQTYAKDKNAIRSLHFQPEILKLVQAELAKFESDFTLPELFTSLAGSDGWNSRDINHMESFSENDYFDWMSGEHTMEVISLVREFLVRFDGQSGIAATVVARIKTALNRIRQRNPLDKIRIDSLIFENTKKEVH